MSISVNRTSSGLNQWVRRSPRGANGPTGVEYVERPLGEAFERGLKGKPHPAQELGGSRVVEDAARRALGRNRVPIREDGVVPIQSFVWSAGHCGREKQRMNVARSLAEIGGDIRPQKDVREPVESQAVRRLGC